MVRRTPQTKGNYSTSQYADLRPRSSSSTARDRGQPVAIGFMTTLQRNLPTFLLAYFGCGVERATIKNARGHSQSDRRRSALYLASGHGSPSSIQCAGRLGGRWSKMCYKDGSVIGGFWFAFQLNLP